MENNKTIIISDFNARILGKLMHAETAPFNQIYQSMINIIEQNKRYSAAIIWTSLEGTCSSMNKYLNENVDKDEIYKEVLGFSQKIIELSKQVNNVFVVSWIPMLNKKYLGEFLDGKSGGLHYIFTKANLILMDELSPYKNIFVINPQKWLDNTKYSFDAGSFFAWKIPFTLRVFKEAAKEFANLLFIVQNGTKKVLLLDLDDTLWGGIVGDDGVNEIKLGGHNANGEAFKDFQTKIKRLKNKGVLLGIVSKNTEEIAINAIKNHPEMVLSINDFIIWRINWNDKAENIRDIAKELNLTLSSFVFIDNSEYERNRIKTELPEVFVPDLPHDPTKYSDALDQLFSFDPAAITIEDIKKTELYAQEKLRNDEKEKAKSLEAWIAGLNITIKPEKINDSNISRATQLLNKTNQMNLSTRRLSEEEFNEFIKANAGFAYYISDKFGDYGLTAIITTKQNQDTLEIIDFVVSCRVMGRQVENTILAEIINNKSNNIKLTFVPTDKNMPFHKFLLESGLIETENNIFTTSTK